MLTRSRHIVLCGLLAAGCSADSGERASGPVVADSAWVEVAQTVDQVRGNLESFERVDHAVEAPGLNVDWEIYFSDDEIVCIVEKAEMGAEGSGEITNVYAGEQLIARSGWELRQLANRPGTGLERVETRILFQKGWPVLAENTADGQTTAIDQVQVETLQRQSEDLLVRLKREVKDKR